MLMRAAPCRNRPTYFLSSARTTCPKCTSRSKCKTFDQAVCRHDEK
jgi:hypothetical protein